MKATAITLLLSLYSITSPCQVKEFNTITLTNRKATAKTVQEDEGETISEKEEVLYEETDSIGKRFTQFSIDELEKLIREYERIKENKNRTGKTIKIHHFYNGKSKKLSMPNLIDVMLEVGVKEPFYVLAQAILETGNFTSNVCCNYNNLFGLFDSRTGDYYRFERWEDSVVGYMKFIQYRYKGGNYLKFLDKIGYAEDPHYIRKVKKIAKQLYKSIL